MTRLLDIVLTRGDDNDMALVTGVDLSGATARFTARYRVGDADSAVIAKTTADDSIHVTNAIGGLATVHILAADWAAYTGKGPLVYDVEVTNAAGKVTTVLKGTITILQDVSR